MNQLINGIFIFFLIFIAACTCNKTPEREVPISPLGIDTQLKDLPTPPTPQTVQLGYLLFFDKRLSADHTVSCATCHRPENAFSEPTAVSTGIRGQKGGRKGPTVINLAWTLYPNFFWDGRAASLEEQAKGPIENPIEMGNTHANVVATLSSIKGYAPYFEKAFGSKEVTIDKVAKAIADYERTRLSGNSAWDKWQKGDEAAVSEEVKLGHDLFHDKAACNQCHLGFNFTDSRFHNLGVGWNAKTKSFKDEGRSAISKNTADKGAFKTPGLRDLTKRAPYMHDGSMLTLMEVVEHYDKGGHANPQLSPMIKPLKLDEKEKKALVAFMQALDGEGWQDKPPESLPN